MAWKQHKRVRYIDFVRGIIGDKDADLFSDDELKSLFDKWSCEDLTTATPTASNNKYKVCACGGVGTPIWELSVTSGVEDAVYILDERASIVLFDPDDDENLAVAPVDGTNINVQFYRVNTPELLSELFLELSSNHTKLTLAHNILGVQMDLKSLADSFYNQSIRWKLEGYNF